MSIYSNVGAYNSALSPGGVGGISPSNTPNRYHTSNVTKHKFYSNVDTYVSAAQTHNAGGRSYGDSYGGGAPSNGYQYKVLSGSSVASHQSRLAAAYAEQAQVDAERQARLHQAAHNDQLKAQQEQYQTQQAYGGQQYQDNTMQYIGMGLNLLTKVLPMLA